LWEHLAVVQTKVAFNMKGFKSLKQIFGDFGGFNALKTPRFKQRGISSMDFNVKMH